MNVPWKAPGLAGDAIWNRVAVYGFGASGQAAAAFLHRRGVEVVVYDRRQRQDIDFRDPMDGGWSWRVGSEPETGFADDLSRLDGIVVSPGVPLDRPMLRAAKERGLPVIAEVELAAPFIEGTLIGITGSNGKSTTTALTGTILRRAGLDVEVCGNIGTPLCAALDAAPPNQARRHFVVELSSFQLESVERFHAQAGALLNLSPDHLDRHRDMDSYRATKARLFATQAESDLAVLNADDPWVADLALTARRQFFSSRGPVDAGCYLEGGQVFEAGSEPSLLFEAADMPLPGPHNVENAMAAALLSRTCGVSREQLIEGLRDFRGLPHRMERVAEQDGVTWYDDSKGTNLGATLRSMEGFADRQLHMILGGRNKGADLTPLRDAVARKARRAYLIGETAAELGRLLQGALPPVDIVRSETLDAAVDAAAETARPGEVVLLSPACASFDQFRNFVERGQVFQQLVLGQLGGTREAANGDDAVGTTGGTRG